MKYNISKEFGILRYLTTTLNPFVLRFASGFMKLLPKGMRSNKALNITRFAIETRDNKKINVYQRQLEKEAISSDENAAKVKVLEAKIQVLEKALENALKNQ